MTAERESKSRGFWSAAWRRFRCYRLGMVGLVIVLVLVIVALFAFFFD